MTQLKRLTPVMQSLTIALGGTIAATSAFAQAQPAAAQKQDRIEVTGSNVKRVDAETVAPVQIITREQIERSGQPTIADVIRNVPANTGSSYGESFSNSFAAGASGVSLRGLGQKATLVLINGRRTAGYGFAQNLQDSFVDLNSIPSSAVERIEVLKDGASAIYGSDALAGVVNVILRKDFKGLQIGGTAGFFEGKGDQRGNITAGFGDLGTQKFSVMGVMDFFKRNELLFSDTEFGKTRDFRGENGGRNFTSLTAGGTWRQLTATNGLTNNFRAITGCEAKGGKTITGPDAIAQGLTTSTAVGAATNTFCTFDQNTQISALPGTQRIGLLSRATFEVSPTITGFAELGYSKVETEQTFTAPFFATTGLLPTSVGLRPFSYNINFAPGASGNPFTSNAQFTGSMQGIGLRTAKIDSDTVRLLAGLQYSFGNWDFDSAVGMSKNKVTQFNNNRLSITGVSNLFGVPTGLQPPIPLSTNNTVNLNTITAAQAAPMFISFPRTAESNLTSFDTKANTTLGNLPGGPIGLAVGIDYRSEKLADVPDPRAQGGQVLGQGITKTDGSRTNFATFGELALPITKTLEAQVAMRSDKYSDFGRATVPKFGAKWKIADGLLMRGNWGKGFRAPTLPEISPSEATFFIQVIDPLITTGNNIVQVSGIYAGNPKLKPETSISRNLGLVFEPSRNFSIGLDLYQISWNDIVGSDSFQSLVDNNSPRVLRDPLTTAIITISNNFRNISQIQTKGADLDIRASFPTTMGRFGLRSTFAYVDSFVQEGTEYAGSNASGASIPRVKATLSADFDNGPWSATGTVNFTSNYDQARLAASYNTTQPTAFQTGVYGPRVRQHETLDLFLRYRMANSLTLSGSIINVANRMPPYDPGTSTTFLYDYTQFDVRGRMLRLSATYKFF